MVPYAGYPDIRMGKLGADYEGGHVAIDHFNRCHALFRTCAGNKEIFKKPEFFARKRLQQRIGCTHGE
jgi:hypothetical protein